MAQFFIDTNILIRHSRQQQPTVYDMAIATYGTAIASAIVVYEFDLGERLARRERTFQDIFPNMNIIPIETTVVNTASRLQAYLVRRNQIIDLADMLIAATALAYHLPLLTTNRRHFERVPDLQLLDIPAR